MVMHVCSSSTVQMTELMIVNSRPALDILGESVLEYKPNNNKKKCP